METMTEQDFIDFGTVRALDQEWDHWDHGIADLDAYLDESEWDAAPIEHTYLPGCCSVCERAS